MTDDIPDKYKRPNKRYVSINKPSQAEKPKYADLKSKLVSEATSEFLGEISVPVLCPHCKSAFSITKQEGKVFNFKCPFCNAKLQVHPKDD